MANTYREARSLSFLTTVAAILLSQFCLVGIVLAAPPQNPHPWIDPTVLMRCVGAAQCGNETTKYFQAIGVLDANQVPTPQRGTFKAWKSTFGFSQDPTTPGPGELRAVYFNNGDLQFGRDMHCRSHSNSAQVGGLSLFLGTTYACYVTNFSVDSSGMPKPDAGLDPQNSIKDAATNGHPIATVAMEVTQFPRVFGGLDIGSTEAWSDVVFIAYNNNGNPLDPGALLKEPKLDSEGPKAMPGICMACHGGNYRSSATGSRVEGANFLPFDTSSFLYANQGAFANAGQFSETTQREAFRMLNAFVRTTRPPRSTITDLIDGWYSWCGGVNAANCFIDDAAHAFVPGGTCPTTGDQSSLTCGWETGVPSDPGNKPPGFAKTFYAQVPAKYCRSCHVALSDRFNVQNFNAWGLAGASVQSVVLFNLRMPHAEVSYKSYWNDQAAQDAFATFFRIGPSPQRQACLTACNSSKNTCSIACNATEEVCLKTAAQAGGLTHADRRACSAEKLPCSNACTIASQPCVPGCPY